jgi:hypothetical protein
MSAFVKSGHKGHVRFDPESGHRAISEDDDCDSLEARTHNGGKEASRGHWELIPKLDHDRWAIHGGTWREKIYAVPDEAKSQSKA